MVAVVVRAAKEPIMKIVDWLGVFLGLTLFVLLVNVVSGQTDTEMLVTILLGGIGLYVLAHLISLVWAVIAYFLARLINK